VSLPGAARADQTAAQKYAESAWTLLNAGQWAQALVEYKLAYEAAPRDEYLFNMANCEYQLGQLKDALEHYEAYVRAATRGAAGKGPRTRTEPVETARMRIEAINRRESVLTIHAVPEGADVRITGPKTVNDRATRTSEFRLTTGHYRVTVSKPTYVSQTSEVDLGFGDAKALFFDLRPIPGRLQIRTTPPDAALYVRGNRAQNPYDQQVEAGKYEIYAEAIDYHPRREVFDVRPAEHLDVPFDLDYVQRSGRPELIGFWSAAGALAMGTAVIARLENLEPGASGESGASGALVAAGAIAGGIGGALISTRFVPRYIRDNVALFRIGNMWIGAVEGAMAGQVVVGHPSLSAAWVGGAVGLGAGAAASVWLDDRAPNYGRVALIQSSAGLGLLAGVLAVPALRPANPPAGHVDRYDVGVLAGVNAGLAAGLALAYLPDQRTRGPTWQRVVLVDLAGAAGGFLGAVATTVSNCLGPDRPAEACKFLSNQPTARATLIGGAVGLAFGWLLTRNLDKEPSATPDRQSPTLVPVPTALAVPTLEGRLRLLPGVAVQGLF
jgi:hypothetical protein